MLVRGFLGFQPWGERELTELTVPDFEYVTKRGNGVGLATASHLREIAATRCSGANRIWLDKGVSKLQKMIGPLGRGKMKTGLL